MKKFLTFILVLFLSVALFSCANEPTEEVLTEYTLSFNDNSKIDLNTGVYTVNADYCSTGKMKAVFNSVIPDEIQFHYLHLWNTKGYYLGYYIGLGNDDTSTKYLGTYTSGEIISPEEPFYFALSINKNAENSLSPIGAYTYQDIFGTPSYLNYTDSVIGNASPTGTLADLGSYSTLYNDDVLNVSLQDAFNNPIYLDYETEYNGMTIEDIFYRGGSNYETPSQSQFLTNPDFTSNVNSWSRAKCSATWVSGGYGTFTKSESGLSFGINQNWDLVPQGHKIFITSRVRSESNAITKIWLYPNIGDDGYAEIDSPVVNNYYEISTIFDNPTSYDLTIRLTAFNSSFDYSTLNLAITTDYIRAYDLTYIFGSGNEPSIEQFKEYLNTDSYNTFRTIQNIGYSGDDLDDAQTMFTARSIPVLTLTNLIQNGQFTTNINNWNYQSLTANWNNGYIVLNGNGSSSYFYIYQPISFNSSSYYVTSDIYLQYVKPLTIKYQDSSNVLSSTILSAFSLNQWYKISSIGSANSGLHLNVLFNFSSNALQDSCLIYIDNVSLFNSSTYTKTQIDNALVNFGYLPYNITYYLPDMGASGTGEREFGTSESGVYGGYSYIANGVGIGTGLQIYDFETMWKNGFFNTLEMSGTPFSVFQNWRSVYGDRSTSYPDTITGINPYLLPLSVQTDFTTDHTARDYYIQLYYDAVNEVDRWEWYSAYGVTAENYSYYAQLFADANEPNTRWEWWKDDGITASNYDYYINPLLTHTLYLDAVNEVERWEWYSDKGITASNYTALHNIYVQLSALTEINYSTFITSSIYFLNTVPLDTATIDGDVYDFTTFKGKTNYWLDVTLGLSAIVINLIALAIMFICLIPLFIFKAQWPFYLIVELPLFSFFVIMEWFAVWVVLIVVALAILLMYLVMNKQNS